MNTFAHSLFQMIRQSRPGTRMTGSQSIEFREDAEPTKLANCKKSFAFFEFYHRGHSNLLSKELLKCSSEEIRKLEGSIARMIYSLYSARWLLADNCLASIEALPVPEGRFLREAFQMLIFPRLQRIAKDHPGSEIMWVQGTYRAKIRANVGRFSKTMLTTFDADKALNQKFSNLGEMYTAFTKTLRAIEKEAEAILKDPNSYPTQEAVEFEEKQKVDSIMRNLLSLLTSEEKTLLKLHHSQTIKAINVCLG